MTKSQVLDSDGDELLSLDEWIKLFQNYDFRELSQGERILIDLKEIIKAQDIDVKAKFQEFSKGEGLLTRDQFSALVRSLAKDIKDRDLEVLFQKFDADKNGKIDCNELLAQFLGKGITQTQALTPIEVKTNRILQEIQNLFDQHKTTPLKLFKEFDRNKDANISLQEFTRMMKALDQDIDTSEIVQLFKAFDTNDDHMISYEEFSSKLGKR